MRPVIQLVDFQFEHKEIENLQFQEFDSDWYGQPPSGKADFCLILDPDSLHFIAQSSISAPDPQIGAPGEFTERLWESDVAEIFIKGEGDDYQEWNLAPNAAWWTQGLSKYRVRDPGFRPDMAIKANQLPPRNGTGWICTLQIPRQNLPEIEKWQINVTMIVASDSKKQFLSCCPETGKEPDFHNAHNYLSPLFKKI